MKHRVRVNGGRWALIGGLLFLMSLASVGYGQAATLTDDEVYWLRYMREEEKLARDVYIFLSQTWGSQVFVNITESEQRHMDAVKMLLEKYGIADPAAGRAEGDFTNPVFNELYVKLTEQGEVSLIEALKVGVFIEETDIDDLNSGIASTRRKDIKNVYSNLLQGSLNHLKAFVSNLAAQGVIYEP